MREADRSPRISKEKDMSIRPLTPKDVQELLKQLSITIELDQIFVDSLPRERFSKSYDDSMWRTWRHDHRVYLEKLLSTVHTIQPSMLSKLSEIAVNYEPNLVGSVLLEHFAEVVGGCSGEDFSAAEHFFGWLIDEMIERHKSSVWHEDARLAISKWLPIRDPLRIAQDPECAYGQARDSLAEQRP
jgi:hypothetical protein